MMTPRLTSGRWQRVQALVETALELDEPARSRYLDQHCADDAVLRRQVQDLIDADQEAGSFFGVAIAAGAEAALAVETPSTGDRLGPFQLTAVLGQGGMGTVYRAIRADDQFQQEVALKVVRAGFAHTAEVQARFRAERQILANLNHPHIARLLDGGMTPGGQPYLVMEFVEGQPIDRYCAARQLAIRARLELFREVCAAVQYAHQNLIVHRDIKPANILVTADGKPKLLDFGIAKLLTPHADGSGATAPDLTSPADRLMTLEYASPEQIRGLPVTTATDVYSLGALLYELLTGTQPYGTAKLDALEAQRRICEDEPGRPSAGHAGVDHDLDDIVAKAMRKAPDQRYVSAQELADDVGRYLAGFPVRASSGAWSYRAGKYIRRHRFALLAAGLLIGVLAGWIVTLRREQAQTRQRFNEVRAMSETLLFRVDESIRPLAGSTPARRMLVGEGLKYLKSLAVDAQADDSLAETLADAYHRISMIQHNGGTANVGDALGGAESLRQEELLLQRLAAKRPGDLRVRAKLLSCYGQMIDTLGTLKGHQAEAEDSYRKMSQILNGMDRPTALHDPPLRAALDVALLRSGVWALNHNDAHTAVARFREVVAMREEDRARDPSSPGLSIGSGRARIQLASALGLHPYSLKDREGALQQQQAGIDLMLQSARQNPLNQVINETLITLYENHAATMRLLHRDAESLAELQKALPLAQEDYRADPKNADAVQGLAYVYGNLGKTFGLLKRDSEALASFQKQYELRKDFAESHANNLTARIQLATTEINYAESLNQFHRPQDATAFAAAGERRWAEIAEETKNPLYMVYQAMGLHVLATSYENQNRWAEAKPVLEKASQLLDRPDVKKNVPSIAADLPGKVQKELTLCGVHGAPSATLSAAGRRPER